MRKTIIAGAQIDSFEQKRAHIRFLNIAGVAETLRPLGHWVGGGEAYEDDSAVPIPSSRFNFLYHHEETSKEINWAPYHLVNALHLSPFPEDKHWYGLVQTPTTCIEDRFCAHPTYPLIWQTIINREIEPQKKRLLHSFLVDLNLIFPTSIDPSEIKAVLLAQDGSALQHSNIGLSPMELYATGIRKAKNNPKMLRLYFNGFFKKGVSVHSENIRIRISKGDQVLKEVPIQVKRGYSSFAEVSILPQ